MNLRGQRVVVIGGTSGIGFAVAEAALREHSEVIVVSSNPEKVDTAVKRLAESAKGAAVDVKNEEAVATFFTRLGAFDHLVFTAGDWGSLADEAMESLDLARAGTMFAVRFWGALAAIKFAHRTIAPGGSITLTDGMIAHRPRRGAALRSAMAGSIEHLTRGLAVDLAPVRVNAVCPGCVRTEVWNSIAEDQREERFRRMTERLPIHRIGEPNEIAEAYLYLMRGGYTTGQILHVDGGMSVV
jgi:NAD(P)-dependent dehydrogenase (short-subunit alcohol dehydrogenase family)